MSEATTRAAAKLRKRYAHTFGIAARDIEQHEYPNGEVEIWFGDFPRWSTGELEPQPNISRRNQA